MSLVQCRLPHQKGATRQQSRLVGGGGNGEATEYGDAQGTQRGNWAMLPGGRQVETPPDPGRAAAAATAPGWERLNNFPKDESRIAVGQRCRGTKNHASECMVGSAKAAESNIISLQYRVFFTIHYMGYDVRRLGPALAARLRLFAFRFSKPSRSDGWPFLV